MADGEKYEVDPSGDPTPGVPGHALPDDAKGPHPLADPANDPTPGVPGHAKEEWTDDHDPGWHCHVGGGDGAPELTIAIVDGP